MRRPRLHPLAGKPPLLPRGRPQKIIRPRRISPRHHHVQLRIPQLPHQFCQPPRSIPHRLMALHLHPRQILQLRHIRCHPTHPRQQFPPQRLHAASLQQLLARARSHHRIQHHPPTRHPRRPQKLRHHPHVRPRRQHPDLYPAHRYIRPQPIQRLPQQPRIHRLHPPNTLRRLHRQRRHRRHPVQPVRRKHLQVRRYTRSRRRIKTRHRQHRCPFLASNSDPAHLSSVSTAS